TRFSRDWSSDVCSSDLGGHGQDMALSGVVARYHLRARVLLDVAGGAPSPRGPAKVAGRGAARPAQSAAATPLPLQRAQHDLFPDARGRRARGPLADARCGALAGEPTPGSGGAYFFGCRA